MASMRQLRCPSCWAQLTAEAILCPNCRADIALFIEDIRNVRLHLLVLAASIVGAMVAFTGAMFWVGIVEAHRLVLGGWGVTALALLGLLWVSEQLKAGHNLDPGEQKERNSNGNIDQRHI